MKFNKKFFKKIKNLEKGKRPNEQSSKEKDKGFSKGKKVECFNYRGLWHFATNCPSPKDIKKSMQDIWSDTNYEESNSTTSENVRRYDPNDFLVFIASMKSVHDSDCDNDSDNEFTDEQKIVFLNNLVF